MITLPRRLKFAALLLLAAAASVHSAEIVGSGVGRFAHPPLRYRGPDPLADQFVPGSALGTPSVLAPPDLPPSEFLAPLGTGAGESIESFLPLEQPNYLESVLEQPPPPDSMISPHKQGFFQKLKLTGTWLDRNDKIDDFGITEFDLTASFAVPLPTREWPLLITPTGKLRLLDGPGTVDLPAQIYETYVEFLWLPKIGQRWMAIIGVAPGIYSDFQVDGSDAFRLTGTGLARFDWFPGVAQLVFGVLYLNRDDIRLLPAGGIIWTPAPGRRYEILFPKPKLAHRIAWGSGFEDWVYLGGEFGGNSYAVERLSGTNDTITLRDFRTYFGLERKLDGGAGYYIEIGYVTGRIIEFQSATAAVRADPTAIIRGGIAF